MLIKGIRGHPAGQRFRYGEADKARRLDQKSRRKILGDGFRVEPADCLKRTACKHRIGAAVDHAVGSCLGHLDRPVEEILFIRSSSFRIKRMLENIRTVEALRCLEQSQRSPLLRRQFQVPFFHVYKIRNRFQEKIALRNHIRIQRHDIRRTGKAESVVQVSGFRALMIRPVKITDAHTLRKLPHLLPVVVITYPDMHFAFIRIQQMRAAVYGLAQKISRFIVRCDKDVHFRVFFLPDHGKGMVAQIEHIPEMHQSFRKSQSFHQEQYDIQDNRKDAGTESQGKHEPPVDVKKGEKNADENHDPDKVLLLDNPLYKLPFGVNGSWKCYGRFLRTCSPHMQIVIVFYLTAVPGLYTAPHSESPQEYGNKRTENSHRQPVSDRFHPCSPCRRDQVIEFL